MQDDCNQQFIEKKKMLLSAVSKVLQEQFMTIDKSIKLFSREYEFSDGQLSKLLREKFTDIKLSTLWKLSNALNIPPEIFISKISNKLPEKFKFYD